MLRWRAQLRVRGRGLREARRAPEEADVRERRVHWLEAARSRDPEDPAGGAADGYERGDQERTGRKHLEGPPGDDKSHISAHTEVERTAAVRKSAHVIK